MELIYKYCKVLDVQPNATQTELKKAFRQKAKQFHPDICKLDNAQEKFVEINLAYDFLIRRAKYGYSQPSAQRATTKNRYTNDDWQNQKNESRQRAERHANMNYRDYKKSYLDKTTRILSDIVTYFGIAFFVIVAVIIPVFLLYRSGNIHFLIGFLLLVLIIAGIVLEIKR